jgi:hypothetical protein
MRLSEWRKTAPNKESLGTQVLPVLKSVLVDLGTEADPECWVDWGEDPETRYSVLAPTVAGVVSVAVRLGGPDEGPRAVAKLIRWPKLVVSELSITAADGHRVVAVQVENSVLKGVDGEADRICEFVRGLIAGIDDRLPTAVPIAVVREAAATATVATHPARAEAPVAAPAPPPAAPGRPAAAPKPSAPAAPKPPSATTSAAKPTAPTATKAPASAPVPTPASVPALPAPAAPATSKSLAVATPVQKPVPTPVKAAPEKPATHAAPHAPAAPAAPADAGPGPSPAAPAPAPAPTPSAAPAPAPEVAAAKPKPKPIAARAAAVQYRGHPAAAPIRRTPEPAAPEPAADRSHWISPHPIEEPLAHDPARPRPWKP